MILTAKHSKLLKTTFINSESATIAMIYGGDSVSSLSIDQAKENAEIIVKSVNQYPLAIEALKQLVNDCQTPVGTIIPPSLILLDKAKEAIKSYESC